MDDFMVESAKAHLFTATINWYKAQLGGSQLVRDGSRIEDTRSELMTAVACYIENLVLADNPGMEKK